MRSHVINRIEKIFGRLPTLNQARAQFLKLPSVNQEELREMFEHAVRPPQPCSLEDSHLIDWAIDSNQVSSATSVIDLKQYINGTMPVTIKSFGTRFNVYLIDEGGLLMEGWAQISAILYAVKHNKKLEARSSLGISVTGWVVTELEIDNG